MLGNDKRITVLANGDIEIVRQCKACDGTGIYVGLAERDGAGVVCHKCKGTGREVLTINAAPFASRVARNDIKRVYAVNPGIVIGEGKDKQYKLSDFGGKPYIDWLVDPTFLPGAENRKFTCPARWYQSADYDLGPNWEECLGCGSFSNCDHFGEKEKCWQRWDEEFREKAEEKANAGAASGK